MEWWQSNRVYLTIEGNEIPVEPNKGYTLNFNDDETINTTEAGTRVRSIHKLDIPQIVVSLDCNRTMITELHTYKSMDSLDVRYYNPNYIGTGHDNLAPSTMYMTGYREAMVADTSDGGIWRVNFTLEELESQS